MANELKTNITIKIDGKNIQMDGRYVGSRGDLLIIAACVCAGLGITPDEIEGDPLNKLVFLLAMKKAAAEHKGTETTIEFMPEGKEASDE